MELQREEAEQELDDLQDEFDDYKKIVNETKAKTQRKWIKAMTKIQDELKDTNHKLANLRSGAADAQRRSTALKLRDEVTRLKKELKEQKELFDEVYQEQLEENKKLEKRARIATSQAEYLREKIKKPRNPPKLFSKTRKSFFFAPTDI